MQTGPITGSQVTDFQATLIDGAYHEVDSSVLTFELAARACFKEGISLAQPVLLEPIMQLEAEMPAEAADGVISDLKTRRAMTLRKVDREGNKLVTAFVPLANLFGYENDFRRLTKGRGSIHLSFERYERTILTSTVDPDGTHPGAAIGLRSA